MDELAPAPQQPGAPAPAGSPAPLGAPPASSSAWRPWTAPAALLVAFIAAAFGGFLVDIPALALGVRITSAHIPPGIVILDTFVQDVGFVATAVFFAQLGGRALRAEDFGLRPTRVWRAVWLIALTIVAFLLFAWIWSVIVHPPKEELLKQLGAEKNAALLIGSALLTCVIAPVSEEFLFRAYIFTALRNWHGTVPAALITGLLFGGVHVTSAPAVDLVPLAFLGFALCLLYQRTRSLYPCIVVHLLNNCYAFGELEEWSAGEVAILIAASLAVLAVIALALTRAGVLGSRSAAVGAQG